MSKCPECRQRECVCGECEECDEKDTRINNLEEDLKNAVEILDSIKVQCIVNGIDNQNKVTKRIIDFQNNMESK